MTLATRGVRVGHAALARGAAHVALALATRGERVVHAALASHTALTLTLALPTRAKWAIHATGPRAAKSALNTDDAHVTLAAQAWAARAA